MSAAGWDGLVDVSLHGPAADVAAVAAALTGQPGWQVIEQGEPHPAAYQPGEHVWLLLRVGGQRKVIRSWVGLVVTALALAIAAVAALVVLRPQPDPLHRPRPCWTASPSQPVVCAQGAAP